MASSSSPKASRRGGKKKAEKRPPFEEPEPIPDEPIPRLETHDFPTYGPPRLKRQRSSTVSGLPQVPATYLHDAPPSAYFLNLFHKINREKQIGAEPPASEETVVLIEMIHLIHKDYRAAIDKLTEDIEALTEEVNTLKRASPQPATPTPIPFPLLEKAPAPADGPRNTHTKPPAVPPPTWATVAKKGRRSNRNNIKPALATARPAATKLLPQRGPTARERRLLIKRSGGPIPKTALELRDEINQAINATYVQTVTIRGNDVTLTTMESVKATSLNSKVGAFLHLIPGTTIVQLDTPVTQLLVHGIPTTYAMATVAAELTTYNAGLALAGQPRWLTTEESRAGKSASSIVIAITGPRAPTFVGKRLAAFSTTYRTERRLRFNSLTQCSNCHGFGHHSNKCTNAASCRWCALTHPTGGHTCPTATCRVRGRPCDHSALKCVNCNGPHDAHSTSCPSHPETAPTGSEKGNEEEMTDT